MTALDTRDWCRFDEDRLRRYAEGDRLANDADSLARIVIILRDELAQSRIRAEAAEASIREIIFECGRMDGRDFSGDYVIQKILGIIKVKP